MLASYSSLGCMGFDSLTQTPALRGGFLHIDIGIDKETEARKGQ